MHEARKSIIAAVCAGLLIAGASASPASALSIQDIQAQIAGLMQQIQDLTAREAGQRVPIQSAESAVSVASPSLSGYKHRVCRLLARDLARGAQGDDVRGLQEFLREQGFFAGNATGFFGPITAQAVAKWQSSEGVSAIGRFGPMSRERMKIWCGGGWTNTERFSASPTRGDAPLAVKFTMKFDAGGIGVDSYTINFGDGSSEPVDALSEGITNCYGDCPTRDPRIHVRFHTYASNGTYTATLIHYSNPCAKVVGCMAPISQEVVGKVQINVGPIACTKEYKPVCGSKPIVCITTPCNPIPTTYGNRCEMAADSASFLYEGQCRPDWIPNPGDDPQCKDWHDGCNSCSRQYPGGPAMCTTRACLPTGTHLATIPYCTAWFESASNQPPVISSFSGPTTLAVNTTGTWAIAASDPESGSLSYNIRWGDEFNPGPGVYAAVEAAQWLQTTTFTHSYANPGAYTITILVRDSAGQEAKTTTTVRVNSSGPIACTADAYQCPDGSYVGRTGPNCQFVCPATSSCTFDGIAVAENTVASCVCSTCGTIAPAKWTCRGGEWKSTTGTTYQSPMKSNYGYGTCWLNQ